MNTGLRIVTIAACLGVIAGGSAMLSNMPGTSGAFVSSNAGISDSGTYLAEGEIPEGVHYFDMDIVPLAGDLADDSPELVGMVNQAIAETNAQRRANGLPEVVADSSLLVCSTVRADECYQVFSHIRPNGTQWYTVNSDIMRGENLAYGYKSANSVVDAWMNSPTHRENILRPEYRTIAISLYVKDGIYYWAQEFGF